MVRLVINVIVCTYGRLPVILHFRHLPVTPLQIEDTAHHTKLKQKGFIVEAEARPSGVGHLRRWTRSSFAQPAARSEALKLPDFR